MAIVPPHRIPVIVGVADVIDRPEHLAQAREPAALMADALLAALRDTGATSTPALLAALDSVDIVAEHSWPYAEPCDVLAARIGHMPRRCVYGKAGGESPVRFIHKAALRIAAGESTVAAIVGAEAQYSVAAASKESFQLPWSPRDPKPYLLRGKDLCHSVAIRHGMTQPVHVYPLYENAATAAWEQTPADALRESAQLWSDFSAVAATHPSAWLRQHYSAEQLATTSKDNRLVAWPYTKHMVANPFVNQGAAIVLTSLDKAPEFGIPEHRYAYIHAGAHAVEPSDYLQRDQYQRSHAQDAVLETMRDVAGTASQFDALDLYSCFPIVPKMARRVLQLPGDIRLTAIGGLSFFGAPLNNYMTHAAAGLVRRLRDRRDGLALLYGQGEFVTKHHALLLSSSPPRGELLSHDVQALADRRRGPIPELVEEYAGPAQLETFTVVYGRSGTPEFGTVIARTPDQRRLMARVQASDDATLQVLTHLCATPVGRLGQVSRGADNLLHWTVA